MIYVKGLLVLAGCVLLVTGSTSEERVELDEALEHEVREIAREDEELARALSEMKRGYMEAVEETLDGHERALSLRKRDLLSDEELHEASRRSLEDMEEKVYRRALAILATRDLSDIWTAFKEFFKKGARIVGKTLKKFALMLIKKGSKALSRTLKKQVKDWFNKGGRKKDLDRKTQEELEIVLS